MYFLAKRDELTMTVIIWIGIVLLFLLSFFGLIFPIIPSVLAVWGGFLLYYFGIEKDELSLLFWIAMAILTLFIFIADLLASSYFVKKYGGSKWGERIAALAIIIGAFIVPPYGILIVPFLAVIITEFLIEKDIQKAFNIGIATLIGLLSGTLAKFIVQLIMIIWFFLAIIF